MKISYNWLKDYVEIKFPPEKLADKLTMAGLEVTSLEKIGGDWRLELEITSNRPDLLSIIGIAREVAAITGKKLKLDARYPMLDTRKSEHRAPTLVSLGRSPDRSVGRSSIEDREFKIKIEDKKDCLQYVGILIKDVAVKESPKWLKQKLESVGLRPVNNVVDITNFCLLETGQPLHAFDFDKLSEGKIIVRRAKPGETIKTIDQEDRTLSSEILVICDSQKPAAIAGVMGGVNSEVTFKTRNILLESAYFNPVLIRRATKILGIGSESSYRFERDVDRANILPSALRAVNLIQELAGGSVEGVVNEQAKLKKNIRSISLKVESVEKLLGKRVAPSRIKQILGSLQFKIKAKPGAFKVIPPGFRRDCLVEADLIEEVSRIDGFENLPQSLPAIRACALKKQPERALNDLTRSFFAGAGFYEIISYSLTSRERLLAANLAPENLIAIKNPLSQEQEVLTSSLIPGLLNAVRNNLNQNIRDLRLFEIGKKYSGQSEAYTLGLAMCGEKSADWLREAKEKISFFDLKGSLGAFLEAAGVSNAEFSTSGAACLNQGAVLKVGAEEVGILGEAADAVLDKWDIKERGIFLAEINLEKLIKFINPEKKFAGLNIFPSIRRDISLVIKEDIAAGKIFAIAKETGGEFLTSLRLVDFYSGGQIPPGFKGLTLSMEFQSKERTLTDNEVNLTLEKIFRNFVEDLGAKIR